MRTEISSSADTTWLLAYELNKRQGAEGVVETKQYYLLTFRKIARQLGADRRLHRLAPSPESSAGKA